VYAYGVRNPQGMLFHPETGQLWESEHGPKGGDELNIITKGANYGWPFYSLGVNYNGSVISQGHTAPNIAEPVFQWTPSVGTAGMAFITHASFGPWKGNLLVGALASQRLYRCVLDGQKVVSSTEVPGITGRVRHVVAAPDGSIWVSIESPGRLVRIQAK
jgi:glucose/arabinose dehydrogenase